MATKYPYWVTLITNRPGMALTIGSTVGMARTSTSRNEEYVTAENATEAVKAATDKMFERWAREGVGDDTRRGSSGWKVLKADVRRGLYVEVTCRTAKDKRKRDTVTVLVSERDLDKWTAKGTAARELGKLARAKSFKTGRVLSAEGYIKHEVSNVQA